MTLSYNVGLTGGSLVAYLLDDLIGPLPPTSPCQTNRSLLAPDNYHKQISRALNATLAPPGGGIVTTALSSGVRVTTALSSGSTSLLTTKIVALASTVATTLVAPQVSNSLYITNVCTPHKLKNLFYFLSS